MLVRPDEVGAARTAYILPGYPAFHLISQLTLTALPEGEPLVSIRMYPQGRGSSLPQTPPARLVASHLPYEGEAASSVIR